MKRFAAWIMLLSFLLSAFPALAQTSEDQGLLFIPDYPGVHYEVELSVDTESLLNAMESVIPDSADENFSRILIALLKLTNYISAEYAVGREGMTFAYLLNDRELMGMEMVWDREKILFSTNFLPEHVFVLGYEELAANLLSPQTVEGIRQLTDRSAAELLHLIWPYAADLLAWAKALPVTTTRHGQIHSESYNGHTAIHTIRIAGSDIADAVDSLLDHIDKDQAMQEILLAFGLAEDPQALLDWSREMRFERSAEDWKDEWLIEWAVNEADHLVGISVQLLKKGAETVTVSLGCKDAVWCFEARFPFRGEAASSCVYAVARLTPVQIDHCNLALDTLMRVYVEEPGKTVSQLHRESVAVISGEYAYEIHHDSMDELTFLMDYCLSAYGSPIASAVAEGSGLYSAAQMDINAVMEMTDYSNGIPVFMGSNYRIWSEALEPMDPEDKELVSLYQLAIDPRLQEEISSEAQKASARMLIALYQSVPRDVIQDLVSSVVSMMAGMQQEQPASEE